MGSCGGREVSTNSKVSISVAYCRSTLRDVSVSSLDKLRCSDWLGGSGEGGDVGVHVTLGLVAQRSILCCRGGS